MLAAGWTAGILASEVKRWSTQAMLNKPLIGIGITTTPNRNYLSKTLKQWRKYLPADARLEVYDDAEYQGISVAKNHLLERLSDCEHIFLADDDTYPTNPDWYKEYVTSSQPHLQYNFFSAPSHWPLKKISKYDNHIAYDKSRGCLLYVERRVLEIVGGMHNVFGKHGREHEDWSERIHKAGLTKYPFQDIATKNFYCLDEEVANISSVDFKDHQGWRYIDSSTLPLYAEYKSSSTPIIVARRNDNGHRDRLWRFLKQNYWAGKPLYEGYHKDGPFNRSLGLNIGATLAGNWDVAVFIDSDTYVDKDRLEQGIELARRTQRLVSPFTRVVELDQHTTDEVLASKRLVYQPFDSQIEKVRTEPMTTQSLMVIVPRNVYEQVGGFDERFVGWGGEDNAFWKATSIVAGEPLRIEGDIFHLWHEPATRQYQPVNNQRWMKYYWARTRQDLKRIQGGT